MDAYCFVVKIKKEDILYLTGLIESYGHLAATSTVDRVGGLVEILASPSYVEDVRGLIKALEKEIDMKIVSERPGDD